MPNNSFVSAERLPEAPANLIAGGRDHNRSVQLSAEYLLLGQGPPLKQINVMAPLLSTAHRTKCRHHTGRRSTCESEVEKIFSPLMHWPLVCPLGK